MNSQSIPAEALNAYNNRSFINEDNSLKKGISAGQQQ